jgi:hypothetical protein
MTPPATAPPLPILHRVCAWHTPQAELDALNLAHPGQVSHTICEHCRPLLEQATA